MKQTKKTAANKAKEDITFAEWLTTKARARGEIAPFVKSAREMKLPKVKKRDAYEKVFSEMGGFPVAWGRYETYCKRGSQSKAAA